MAEELKKKLDKEKQMAMEKLQAEALEKQKTRNDVMGELLRSKGFLWIATSNDLIGGWQQAGNVVRIRSEVQWMCLTPQFWEGTSSESLVRQNMKKETGEEWEYKDRRQEIVFIGHGMKHDVIQKILDECLLTDEEMALGPEKWLETMEEDDNIQLGLEQGEYEIIDESNNEETEDEEDDENDNKEETEGKDVVMKKKTLCFRGAKQKPKNEEG